jgi:hypothetical protein
VAPQQHPLLPYVKELERPYSPDAHAAIRTTEVVGFAHTMSDSWAERAVERLESWVQAESMEEELRALVADKRRSQSLRHRAMRFINRPPRPSGT